MKITRTFLGSSLALFLPLIGCTTGPVDHRVDVPAPPQNGIQFVMPDTVIPAASERMMCWIPDWIPNQDYLVSAFEGVQSVLGHHVVALRSGIPRNAGDVFDCTQLESMTTLEPLILPDLSTRSLLPDGYAVKLPADARIVIQSHYVNTTADDVLIADVARFHWSPDPAPVIANYLILNDGAIDIAPGPAQTNLSCSVPTQDPINILLWLGHMHEWGTAIDLTVTRADNSSQVLYEVDPWKTEFRDLPPITFFDEGPTLVLDDTDTLDLNCAFDNTGDTNLTFPGEMCTAVAYYYPSVSDAPLFCGN